MKWENLGEKKIGRLAWKQNDNIFFFYVTILHKHREGRNERAL